VTSEAKYLDVSAENLYVTIYQKTESRIRQCNLLEENKSRTTNDLRRKDEENKVLCINRMLSDVIAFIECNDVTDAKLSN